MAAIGFVGLGAMGAPMAQHLLASQHSVTVFARRADVMTPFLDAGARAASSPADLASRSDIVCIMVTDTAAVEEVILGTQGIVHGARDGLVVIDHSTIIPARARRLAADLRTRGIAMLDAPVSGGVAAAAAGTLSIMVGGEATVYERCRPILLAFGQTVTYMGDSGAGQVAKACNQICTIVNQHAAAEAMLLAERSGVDPLKVRDALMAGFGASRMLELQAPKMVARAFEGRVESRLHHKDILIVLEMARELGIGLPASAAAARTLAELQARGGAKKDSAAVFTILAGD
ncbi:MAG: NAD(P)-dependent oxidoreductase [Vicinamibacterales bacterium]|nr:NAD(P)-dependent oxidoreductase [Vicinamibacterales bacterium]